MSLNILAFGEILWDILPDRSILGGAPFNFAYRVNSLGDRGIFVSRLGQDKLGRKARAQVKKLGIDTSFLQTDEHYPTGTVHVSFDANNTPDYVIVPDVAYDHIQPSDKLMTACKNAACVCFGTLIQRTTTSRETLETVLDASSGALKFLDINLRKKCFTKSAVLFSLKHADILKLNDDEVRQLGTILDFSFNSFQDFCQYAIKKWQLQYVLVSFGEYGACACSLNGEFVYSPGYKVNTIDSLGAGDAFSAGFLYNILRHKSLKESCKFGNVLGALVAATQGATEPIEKQQINDFSQSESKRLYHFEFA